MTRIFSGMSSEKISNDLSMDKFAEKDSGSFEISFLIAKFLSERGIDRIFGICGGHILPIWDHAARLGIKIIDVRDERSAVHMAQIYSELTGKVGTATVTAGPGVTNAATGIANAHVSRVPLLVISGVPPRPQRFSGALQELPQVDMVKPVCRYARTVTYAGHVLRELDEAIACARGQGNEPGPAFIDFPTDLLRETLPLRLIETDRFKERKTFANPVDESVIYSAADILCSAKRPVIITGRGARGTKDQLTDLLYSLGAVYLDTTESRGLIPEDHPSYVPAARGRAMKETDLIITIGRSLDFQLAYGSPAVFGGAKFVRIGTSALELRDNRRGDVEICGPVKEIIAKLTENIRERDTCTDNAWIQDIKAYNKEKSKKIAARFRKAKKGSQEAMHPYELLAAIKDCLDKKAIVIADGGDILSFTRIALSGEFYFDPGGFGCLGVGVPFGVAAALVYPDRQVVSVCGDGSFGFNAVDIDTAKRHGAKVVFVVANNSSWGIERNDQISTYAGRIVGTELQGCDYAAMARAFGLHSERVEDAGRLPQALREAFKNAPSLLDVVVTKEVSSPDGQSGLPVVPDYQALGIWDKMERDLIGLPQK